MSSTIQHPTWKVLLAFGQQAGPAGTIGNERALHTLGRLGIRLRRRLCHPIEVICIYWSISVSHMILSAAALEAVKMLCRQQ